MGVAGDRPMSECTTGHSKHAAVSAGLTAYPPPLNPRQSLRLYSNALPGLRSYAYTCLRLCLAYAYTR